ncbi:MAG TPA: ATP-binding cassette domain-containing protein [Anaerolineales bacterium]
MDTAVQLIVTKDLRRTFKDKQAVGGASFSVKQGEIFGLLGPNGAGETPTIRRLTGQIDPRVGEGHPQQVVTWRRTVPG